MRGNPCLFLAFVAVLATTQSAHATSRPNILWLTSEDNGPHLGCYGDSYATTPALDQLAARAARYTICWSQAPVCAPARTTIITGVYPPTTGSEHMRSIVPLPVSIRLFPEYLREAGYYCTNNQKEDYNVEPRGKVWDDSSKSAHWKNRPSATPFFAVFNHTITHESRIRTRPHTLLHDPAHVRVPAYHPDLPEVRTDWAQYYDRITEMDTQVAARLKELEDAGLADDTIIFYYADHGSGMPRNKRWPYNSGLHVPCLVYVPPKWNAMCPQEFQAGRACKRPIGFVDLAPTVLSLASIKPPAHMQGRAFLGPYAAEPAQYQFGFRGRMDECYDMVRSVRDERYVYIRNYYPHQPYGQFLRYMFQTPTTRVWKAAFEAGSINEAQSHFWRRKPPEELYDLQSDPDEVVNLATAPQHAKILNRLRNALQDWITEVRDLGFLPEDEIHARRGSRSPYELGLDDQAYPLRDILHAANMATQVARGDSEEVAWKSTMREFLEHEDAAIRYWGVVGFRQHPEHIERETALLIQRRLSDACGSVAALAAEALLLSPHHELEAPCIQVLIGLADAHDHDPFAAIRALGALRQVRDKLSPYHDAIRNLPLTSPNAPPRVNGYVGRLLLQLQDG